MKRRSRVGLIFLGVLAVLIALPVVATWRAVRQERLNRDLIAAVNRNDTAAVVSLLNQGADANCRDEPPRHLTLWQTLMQALHTRPTKPSNALTPLLLAMKLPEPLHWSVPAENVPLIRALLDHGAKVNQTDEHGFTPLMYATMRGQNASIHLLLLHETNVNQQASKDLGGGIPPLVMAAGNPSIETGVIADLLDHGADINQRDANLIILNGSHTGTVEADINQRHANGETALYAATETARIDVVRLLLARHADPTLNFMGQTPLACALANNTPESRQIVRLLRQAGARK